MHIRQEINVIYDPIRNRYKGVYPSLDRWQSIIQSKGICLYLGRFETQQEAAECVVEWYKEKYGPLWKGVITRNSYGNGNRLPWEVSKCVVRGQFITGWRATVWVSGKAMNITPTLLEIECGDDVWDYGCWLDEAYARSACDQFCERFRARKTDHHVLFRCA